MIPTEFEQGLGKYIPQSAIPVVYSWIKDKRVKIKITPPRSSKLGDFRIKSHYAIPQISVNGNLNPYSFLVTLTHEVAHFEDYMLRKSLRDPHGESWKRIYAQRMKEVYDAGAFPESLKRAIIKHIKNPKAASCSDPELNEALRVFDQRKTILLKEIPEGDTFILSNGRQFVKGELQRTRYRCRDVSNGRWYLVHGQAEVFNLS